MTESRAIIGIVLDLILAAVVLGMGAWMQHHWSLRRQFQLHIMIPSGQAIGMNLPVNWWMHTHGNEPMKIKIADDGKPPIPPERQDATAVLGPPGPHPGVPAPPPSEMPATPAGTA